jgi:hypothetical protein
MMFIDCRMVVVMGIEVLLFQVTFHKGDVDVGDDDDE